MTEELTAEEREWLLRAGRRENKLVHALDAALARAKAAEQSLAEARTALNEAMTSAGNNPHWKGWEKLVSALSRTPAPAADPVQLIPDSPPDADAFRAGLSAAIDTDLQGLDPHTTWTQRKASPEIMARLCEAVDAYSKGLKVFETINVADPTDYSRLADALSAYRSETTPPLRSRAEVDAEIVTEARLYWAGPRTATPLRERRLNALCAEPTAPEPAPSAEPYRVHDLRNTFTGHDQDTREERPCGCEDSDRLNGYLRDIKFLHRQWSDEKGLAGHTLTQIGNVVLRWMSSLP